MAYTDSELEEEKDREGETEEKKRLEHSSNVCSSSPLSTHTHIGADIHTSNPSQRARTAVLLQ